MPVPVTVADARARARKRLERELRDWAVDGGDGGAFELPLHPPTQRAVLADQQAARAWAESWRSVGGVVWARRDWANVGSQEVPERLVLRGASAIAAFAGDAARREWRTARAHVAQVIDGLDSDAVRAAVRPHVRRLQAASDDDVGRIVGVVRWLAENPASGLRIRHVPLRGVDTKWLAGHRAVVEALYCAVTGEQSLGILSDPPSTRMRMLDPGLWRGGLADATASASQWARLAVPADAVLVVENLETLLALPAYPGVVAVHGSGYGIAERLAGIPWIEAARCVLYWGDLDSHGFGILNQFRSSMPRARSILMDEGTLVAHRDLWVPEPTPTHARLALLTAREGAARARVAAEGDVRLEQERIPWEYARGELDAVLLDAMTEAPR